MKYVAIVATALALALCFAQEPGGPYAAYGKGDHVLVEPLHGPNVTIPWENTMNLHTRAAAWDACIEAADVLAEGDITPDENDRLTEHCELMVLHLSD